MEILSSMPRILGAADSRHGGLRMTAAGLLLVWMVGIPATAQGQAAVAGRVTDETGASLPRVTVEAHSPVLIEALRATSTDATGQYRIEDLRPGVYSLIFRADGWRTLVRTDVEVTGSATAIVDVELRIGPLADTMTVTGETPVVDVYSSKHEVTLGGDVLRTLPTVRSYNALLPLVPGVVTTVNDIVTATATTAFPIHGGRSNEGRLMLDGLNVGSPPAGNSAASYVVDLGNAQEVTLSASGALGDVETSGLVMNIVPKVGGNAMRGSLYGSGTSAALQANNLTPALQDQGLTAATPLTKVYDLSATLGGPIVRDRIWYFADGHLGSMTKTSANVYYNLNAGDATKWLYTPDVTRREYSDRTFENAGARITWQATPRNKIGVFWDAQALCRTCSGATPGLAEPARISPEAVGVLGRPLHVTQATWSSPVTNALFVEAGYGGTVFGVGNFERVPNPTRDLIRVAEQCASGCAANGNIPGLVYRSQDFSVAHAGSYLWKGSISYVTGTHAWKIGYQHTLMTDDRTWMTNSQDLTYRLNNGVPNQLTQSISPWVNDARAAWDGLFAQEQWRRRRLTLHGAVRFDRSRSWYPAQQEGPSRFLPVAIRIPETPGVDSYKDITPRFGAAYDLRGDGRTALKVNLGRYLEGAGVAGTYANANPTLRLPQTTMAFGTAGVTRAWIDANGNFVPDCDLLNPSAQDRRDSGGDLCGVISNTNFGRNVVTNEFDPRVLDGWGIRPSDWTFTAAIEHQFLPRAAVNVEYTRRWFNGFSVADNLALESSDLTPFTLVAPRDPRLPGGGGYVVSGLYDVAPGKAGQVNNLVTDSSAYGVWSQYFNGVDVTLNVRTDEGLTIAGGTSTGQTVADNCAVRARLPELSTATTGTSAFGAGLLTSAVAPLSPYCHVAYGFQTQFRGLASYVIPRADIQVAATVQSRPGPILAADYAAPSAVVADSLGRTLSGNAANVTINLVRPGVMYGERINEIDLRAGKVVKFGGSRATVALDFYNALNSSAALTYNNAFVPGGTWPQPLTIMSPRCVKITAEVNF
jgi:carboxypeptidase family protein